jgi:site-specific DNA recombinase
MIPAVVYYRMSTERQEDSIERQRSQVEPFATRQGYKILREYKDEGIAGDEEEKRKDFMRMMRDAQRREFEVILCDDKDRFGRFDSITQGYYVKPLRDAGVRLETVAQGKVDWFSFAGRVTDAVLQEAKKIESQATSRRVITRMLLMAKQGKWLGGVPPYAYVLTPDAILGKKLVPGDPLKVMAVQMMFELYGDRGFTLDMVARELYERGIPNPRGGPTWNKTTVRSILRCRKYVGDLTWNSGHDGKYSEVAGGIVRTTDSRIPKRALNDLSDWIIVPDTHEPLIDRALFERVQAKLAKNKFKTTPLPKGGQFVLSGLLTCGHCGWRMIGSSSGEKRSYKCGRYHQEGKHACGGGFIMESKLLDCLTRKLQDAILDPRNAEKLREEMRRQGEKAVRSRPAKAAGMQSRIDELARKIDAGIERMSLIDHDLLTEYAAKVRAWKAEREKLSADLNHLINPPEHVNLDEVFHTAERQMYRLREAFAKADPFKVREVLRELVTKVELWFDHRPMKGKTRCIFRRGVIHVRPQQDAGLTSSLLNAASPIPVS